MKRLISLAAWCVLLSLSTLAPVFAQDGELDVTMEVFDDISGIDAAFLPLEEQRDERAREGSEHDTARPGEQAERSVKREEDSGRDAAHEEPGRRLERDEVSGEDPAIEHEPEANDPALDGEAARADARR